MSAASEKLARAAWRLTPAPIARRLQTEAGNRFLRFLPAAAAAVITSQVVLAILTGPVNLGGFTSGFIASMVAAGVSYLMSRWAWERKGKPDLLRETLPFWAVSVAVWVILGLTTHFANSWAVSAGLHHFERHLVVNGAYLAMNCITFVCRFLIFHYALFNDRRFTRGGAHAATEKHATAVTGAADGESSGGEVQPGLDGSYGRLADDTPAHRRVPS